MDIASTTAAPQARTQPTVNATPKSAISSDFDTFLRMLTVQLTNQDPLNPVDSADYAVQLATFSGVEQQVQTNGLLRSLVEQLGAGGIAQYASWIGMEARAAVPVYVDGAPVTLSPRPMAEANAAMVVVRDSAGQEVQRFDVPLTGEDIIWAGVTTDGAPLPPGIYRFDTVSYDGEVVIGEAPAEAYARVVEVQVKDGVNRVIFAGGGSVDAATVTALRDGG